MFYFSKKFLELQNVVNSIKSFWQNLVYKQICGHKLQYQTMEVIWKDLKYMMI